MRCAHAMNLHVGCSGYTAAGPCARMCTMACSRLQNSRGLAALIHMQQSRTRSAMTRYPQYHRHAPTGSAMSSTTPEGVICTSDSGVTVRRMPSSMKRKLSPSYPAVPPKIWAWSSIPPSDIGTPQDVNENGDLRESKRPRLTREIRIGSKAARRMLRGVHFSLGQVEISLECLLRKQLHPDLHEKAKCLAVDLEKAMTEADLEALKFVSAKDEDWPAMRLYELESTSCRLKTTVTMLQTMPVASSPSETNRIDDTDYTWV